VQATPLRSAKAGFTIITLKDISHEKRRRALEQIFFHDVLNTASCLQIASELLKNDFEHLDEIRKTLIYGVHELIDEINSQKVLMAAENHDLILRPTDTNAQSVIREAKDYFEKYAKEKEVSLLLQLPDELIPFQTDKNILLRVLGNMIKNAIEASRPHETVTIRCMVKNSAVVFEVHNAAVMPKTVQLQLFQRSFSTKGIGRGLGTYGMKLLSERYLKGKVSFRSSRQAGTVFSARYPLIISKKNS
jgi:signal transduction histidine kinase